MRLRLRELAECLEARLEGDPERYLLGLASLEEAGPDQLSFLDRPAYTRFLVGTRAGAVLLRPADRKRCPVDALVCDDPYLAYAHASSLFYPPGPIQPGIHPSAVLDASAQVDPGAQIGPGCVLGPGVRVDSGVSLGPNCVLGKNVVVGVDSRLEASVVLYDEVRVGCAVLLHSGVVVGADGFGFAQEAGTWCKIRQVGGVCIKDHVEIGANSTVDRGALGDTLLEQGVKLDNQVQVGHNVYIGAHTIIAGCTAIAGSVRIGRRIGRRCRIGGKCAINGHLSIADDVVLAGMTAVSGSIRRAGAYASSLPHEEIGRWRRNVIRVRHLDKSLRRLERATGGFSGERAESPAKSPGAPGATPKTPESGRASRGP